MKTLDTVYDTRLACRAAKLGGVRLGLVPTMGALHEGHLSLVRAAKARCGVVTVSIFVNPTQFGPNEDFANYPRTLARDCELLEREGVDLLFAPAVEEMYPAGAATYVAVEGMSERLCGKSRPGHFRGVTTVVSKLFNIIEPDLAFFGQKDAAQVAIIRRMVVDLKVPVEIVACPIVREADGLAMSSRNAYLNSAQRKAGLVLFRALSEVRNRFEGGERRIDVLVASGMRVLQQEPLARIDYLEIVDPNTLEALTAIAGPCLVAAAAFVGTTRLLDNIIL